MNVVDMLQKQFQESAENLQTVQKEYSKTLADRQTLDSQLNENKQVKEELDIAVDGANVFKLIGPVLIKQDLEEAKVVLMFYYRVFQEQSITEQNNQFSEAVEPHVDSNETL